MDLSKQRLELKMKLEGKWAETQTPIKKESKSVSKLVIPQQFLSKSVGNLTAINPPISVSTSFKLNSKEIEINRRIRSPSERKLSSKSFSVSYSSENIEQIEDTRKKSQEIKLPSEKFEDTRKKSQEVILQAEKIEDTRKKSQEEKFTSEKITEKIINPVVVGSIPKETLPEITTFNFIRSPKIPKEEENYVMHFNFVEKSREIIKPEMNNKLRKIPSLKRSGNRCAILVPREDEKTIEEPLKETFQDNEKEDEIYVNIETIRNNYHIRAIMWGPINKIPVPSIRYSLMRKSAQ